MDAQPAAAPSAKEVSNRVQRTQLPTANQSDITPTGNHELIPGLQTTIREYEDFAGYSVEPYGPRRDVGNESLFNMLEPPQDDDYPDIHLHTRPRGHRVFSAGHRGEMGPQQYDRYHVEQAEQPRRIYPSNQPSHQLRELSRDEELLKSLKARSNSLYGPRTDLRRGPDRTLAIGSTAKVASSNFSYRTRQFPSAKMPLRELPSRSSSKGTEKVPDHLVEIQPARHSSKGKGKAADDSQGPTLVQVRYGPPRHYKQHVEVAEGQAGPSKMVVINEDEDLRARQEFLDALYEDVEYEDEEDE